LGTRGAEIFSDWGDEGRKGKTSSQGRNEQKKGSERFGSKDMWKILTKWAEIEKEKNKEKPNIVLRDEQNYVAGWGGDAGGENRGGANSGGHD